MVKLTDKEKKERKNAKAKERREKAKVANENTSLTPEEFAEERAKIYLSNQTQEDVSKTPSEPDMASDDVEQERKAKRATAAKDRRAVKKAAELEASEKQAEVVTESLDDVLGETSEPETSVSETLPDVPNIASVHDGYPLDAEGFVLLANGSRDRRYKMPYAESLAIMMVSSRTKEDRMADIFGKPGEIEWRIVDRGFKPASVKSATGSKLKRFFVIENAATGERIICGKGEMEKFAGLKASTRGAQKAAQKMAFDSAFSGGITVPEPESLSEPVMVSIEEVGGELVELAEFLEANVITISEPISESEPETPEEASAETLELETAPETPSEPETVSEQKASVDPEPETAPEQKASVDPEPEMVPELEMVSISSKADGDPSTVVDFSFLNDED